MLSEPIEKIRWGFLGKLVLSVFLALLGSVIIGGMPVTSEAAGTVTRDTSVSSCRSHQIDYLIIAASTFDEYRANAQYLHCL